MGFINWQVGAIATNSPPASAGTPTQLSLKSPQLGLRIDYLISPISNAVPVLHCRWHEFSSWRKSSFFLRARA